MKTILTPSLILLCSFFASPSHAQKIEKIKDNSCLINMEGNELPIGGEYLTVNDVGRKTGLIKIKNVRGGKAIATVLKGIVVIGEKLEPKPAPKSRFEEEPTAEDIEIRRRPKVQEYSGVLFAYSSDSMGFSATNSTASYTENVSLTGSSLKIKGFYDFPWDKYTIRLTGGLDGFNGKYTAVSTSINKDGSNASTLSMSYLAAGAEIQYAFYKKQNLNLWAGLDYSFLYSMSSATNIYSVTINSAYAHVFSLALGANLPFAGKQLIPVYFKYNYYFASPQTSLEFGGGWGTSW